MKSTLKDNNELKTKDQRIKEISVIFPKIAQILENDLAEKEKINQEFGGSL